MEELEKAFSIERVSKSGGVFDTEKLNWVNHHYMKEADDAVLAELCMPYLVEAGYIAEDEKEAKMDLVKEIVSAVKEKLHYAKEITDHVSIFFGDKFEIETEEGMEFLKLEHIPTLFDALREKIEAAENFDADSNFAILKSIQKEYKIKGKNLYMGSRIMLTGQMHGPDIPKVMEVLGKENCLRRLDYVKANVLDKLN